MDFPHKFNLDLDCGYLVQTAIAGILELAMTVFSQPDTFWANNEKSAGAKASL